MVLVSSTAASRLLLSRAAYLLRCAQPLTASASMHSFSKQRPLVCTQRSSNLVMQCTRAGGAAGPKHDHAKHFVLERYWAVGMLPLFPAALFIHNPMMDYALAIAIGMHIHWGIYGVVQDYARPIIMGDFLASISRASVYIFSAIMFAGLLHFNWSDVGITRAFEMLWAL